MLTQVKIIPLLLFVFTLNCGKNQPIQFSGETMGTTYQITIIINSNNEVDAIQLQKKVDSLLTQVNNIFSTYIENSELTQFNDNLSTIPIKISPEFSELYEKAVSISLSSDGSFDFTVLPLVKLWGFGQDFNISQIPSDEKIQEKLNYSGIDKLEFENASLRKENKHTQIDFSAIAKGWGVDQVALFLNDTAMHITDAAVATSGSYNNYFTLKNIDYSHILDPKTGYPIQHDLVSATIVAQDCATADAIATAVMVKGFDRGLRWINNLSNVECLLVKKTDTGEYLTGRSSGFNY